MSGTKEITLTNTNETAIIDEDDYGKVISLGDWYKSDTGYAVRRYNNSTLRMHRLINNTPKGVHTDHINHNKLDNRRHNLRTVSQAQNAQNGSGKHHTKHIGLPRGITWDYTRSKYLATRTLRRRFNTLKEAKNFVAESEDK